MAKIGGAMTIEVFKNSNPRWICGQEKAVSIIRSTKETARHIKTKN